MRFLLKNYFSPKQNRGLTFLELLTVLLIITIISTMAGVSLHDNIVNKRLEFAANSIYSDLNTAKSDAIKLNKRIFVSFNYNAAQWCYGLSVDNPCDCTKENQCEIAGQKKIVSNQQFENVSIQRAIFAGRKKFTVFDPAQGFAIGSGAKNGTIWLKGSNDAQIAIIINRIGRIRYCSPTLPNYSTNCPKNPN